MPALSDSVAALGQAAGGNATEISTQAMLSAGFGIAGALAGIAFPPVGAGLAIASYLAAIVPSASPESNTAPVMATITQLQNDLASAVSNAPKVVESQSFEVRQSYGMLRLVAELSGPGGPWSNVNAAGLRGSMEEGFALWAENSCCRRCLTATTSASAVLCRRGVHLDWIQRCHRQPARPEFHDPQPTPYNGDLLYRMALLVQSTLCQSS